VTLRLAHRGDWRVAPENSLEAMAAALRIPGCDGLEFDVRCSADGIPVVIHDETLVRVQRIPLACVSLTAAQLADHGIPTLAQVLDAAGPDAFLDVELKERVDAVIPVLEAARGATGPDGRRALRAAVVSSFHPDILAWLRHERPGWTLWGNTLDLEPGTIAIALELGISGLSVDHRAIDDAAMARAADAGMDVAAWTVRDVDDYRRLETLGVVAVCVEAAALEGEAPLPS
jgi:glycerophosphoryl diester phosphodiesterase